MGKLNHNTTLPIYKRRVGRLIEEFRFKVGRKKKEYNKTLCLSSFISNRESLPSLLIENNIHNNQK